MLFLNKYNVKKNIRFNSFKFALEEAFRRNLKIIVETGVARGKQKFLFFSKANWKDGMSTLIFSEYASYVDGHLHACDINPRSIKNAKKFTNKFKDKVVLIIFCLSGEKAFTNLLMVPDALFVCNVPKTRCPVSAIVKAAFIDSASRNSPIATTSGSCLNTLLSEV